MFSSADRLKKRSRPRVTLGVPYVAKLWDCHRFQTTARLTTDASCEIGVAEELTPDRAELNKPIAYLHRARSE